MPAGARAWTVDTGGEWVARELTVREVGLEEAAALDAADAADAERRRLLEDPQASVRRTVRQWLQCQRADAGAYTKCYSNPFSDYRPPGSASDNLRDPLHLAVRRVAAAAAGSPSGGRRRSSVEQALVQRSNLLLICRDVLTGPARGVLPPATAETAAVVLRAAPEVQQLLAQVRKRSLYFTVSL